jgi:hypothetical protein
VKEVDRCQPEAFLPPSGEILDRCHAVFALPSVEELGACQPEPFLLPFGDEPDLCQLEAFALPCVGHDGSEPELLETPSSDKVGGLQPEAFALPSRDVSEGCQHEAFVLPSRDEPEAALCFGFT